MPGIGVRRGAKVFMNTTLKLFFLITLLFVMACNNNDENSENLIDQLGAVDERINLSDPEYETLRQVNGYKYLDAGRRGILVINRGINNFVAFERNCTFQPNSRCATVSMHPSLEFLLDSCCSSQFDLNGQVTQPPATQPLIQYRVTQVGNDLVIQFP
jgi:hypothetical protein